MGCVLAIFLTKCTVEMLILNVVSQRASYGYEISQTVLRASRGYFDLKEGSLYPALHRMEKRGLIEATWGVSPKGRRAKYYGLSAAGERELASEEARWSSYVEAVGKIAVAGPES